MNLGRWLLVAALVCALAGAGTLTLALCCIAGLVGGQCELWLLGPLVAVPLGVGLGAIGRAFGRPAPVESECLDESHGCGEREDT